MDKRHSRREFIRVASLFAGAVALPEWACHPKGPAPIDCTRSDCQLPSLGGAPDTDEGRTIAAFVDTVIPGAYRDPKGVVGGIDVNAPALFFDPELPGATFVPALVLFLDGYSNDAFGNKFQKLTAPQREKVLDTALVDLPILDLAVELAKLATYSTVEAGRALGYPGANGGYINDSNYSFRLPLTKELFPNGGNYDSPANR